MATDVQVYEARKDDLPFSRAGLGVTNYPSADVQLGCGPAHPQGASVLGDVLAPQLGQFLRAHRGERPEKDHQTPADADRLGDREDLLDGGYGALVRLLLAPTTDTAGVAADQVVRNSRLHDRLQQPVRLGNLCLARGLQAF